MKDNFFGFAYYASCYQYDFKKYSRISRGITYTYNQATERRHEIAVYRYGSWERSLGSLGMYRNEKEPHINFINPRCCLYRYR